MTTTADRPKFKVVGTRPIRHDGLDKVTGRAKYGADVIMPGLLHGKILRSPHAHARIKRIDVSKALALPGVKAVVTHADFPKAESATMDAGEGTVNVKSLSENALADQKALYKGHAVAAVAAISAHIAEEALELIKVEYEVLPPVLDAKSGMKADAPQVHEGQTTKESAAAWGPGKDTGVKSNIASHIQFKNGDAASGFKQADVVVEREFTTKPVHQGYIEPHSSTASWGADGRLTIWTSTQHSFGIRSQTAAILRLPESQLKVVPMEIGGGFGGKIPTYMDAVAAILSKKTGHPVKLTMTRKEEFEATGPTSGSAMRCKIGATKDGKLVACELWMAFEAGAWSGSPVGAAAMCALAPYQFANFVIDGYDVVVNKPKVAAYRAPGAPQGAFAIESVIDEVAEKLKMDPLELRLKNASKQGDRQATGMPFGSIGCKEVEEALKNSAHYKSPLGTPSSKTAKRGRGVAMGFWFNIGFHSSVTINVNGDGTVSLISGSVDIGGTRAAVAMQAAEVLGLRAEDIIPSVADTDSVGFCQVTGGSRTAFATGIAAITCAEEIKKLMKERAAKIWETQAAEIDFKDGVFISKKNPKDSLTFKQLAGRLMQTGGPLTASVMTNATGVGSSFAGTLVDVEVDTETGKVDVIRATGVQDVGQAAHPSYVEGQVQGGTVQGIGWALNEEYFYNDQGVMANSSFLDYRMPTSLDLPMVDAVLVQVPNPGHPFGLRGVGEVSIVPPMAAVANAVHNAIGTRMGHLPITPGSVVKALQKK